MLRLQISNMRCMACVRKMKDEITEFDPNVKITADVPKGLVDIESKLESEVLMIILKMAGFHARDVTKLTSASS